MVWAKLDDEILDNRKIIETGPLGFALHVAAISWCARNLTDGFIPHAKVKQLLDFHGLVRVTGQGEFARQEEDVDPYWVASENMRVGLWRRDDELNGYWIQSYLEYNPSRAYVLSEREARSIAGKRGAEKRWSNGTPHSPRLAGAIALAKQVPWQNDSKPVAGAMANAWQNHAPDPVPDPDPSLKIGTEPSVPPPEPVTAVRSRRKPESLCPESGAKPEEVSAWAARWKIPEEHAEFLGFLDHHRKKDSKWRDWAAAWRTWLRNGAKFARSGRGAETTKQPYDPNAPWLKLPEVS